MTQTNEPWLVAIWPGMGSVALLAGSYLLEHLEVQRVAELNARDYFEVHSVDVKDGIATVGRLPRNLFFEWKDPAGRHDLLVFVGEAQPGARGYELCQRIIDFATQRNIKRFFTFAAMATQLHLGSQPRVFAVATDPPLLRQITSTGVEILEEGQIGGLNGLLLAAGAERGLQGTCLLGEMPFFATGVPNPRAAQAVLQCFTEMAGIEMDLGELRRQAEVVEEKMQHFLEQMNDAGMQLMEGSQDAADSGEPEPKSEKTAARELDPKALRRIEHLFERAREDRSKAVELKRELDRLGVFKQFENRFLDLFRKGE